ncbi:hypothetical protein METBIDRAFT_131656 [Metschnikowia bicuspidata var. bicuspidata NRRL YB-4993]|uniref:Uncharacterized protein n=1 Tax=Metschnikowia bicuspidata var. bicuspidata NRRL YB-4993 TaxID=869754 RepID=A0A1A0HKP0_9ASCO|nr:hypothetical protein METBIDRAFT_131656 [Metschnikowia bicuspidata var. bicuspidata NRRL YB-4993]OBA24373.1 hypothetical protein METBIDRAFT_131656 [Metschnikowia bicuspidata var. bicuspidata NRRL YB-4993]
MPASQDKVSSEDKLLEDFQGFFIEETDPQIAEKRKEVLKTLRENDVESFPSDLTVITAFDEALQCFSIGGQVRNYYRYGTYSLCEAAREKMWFAFKNGAITNHQETDVDAVANNPKELQRRKTVQEYYKQKLMEKKMKGSSEDIWDKRKTLLKNPFKE